MKLKSSVTKPQNVKPTGKEFLMLADYLALDFLNTVVRIDGELVDLLQNDDDVLRWLAQAGRPINRAAVKLQPGLLLEIARAVRLVIPAAIERIREGNPDGSLMNMFLSDSASYMTLEPDDKGGLRKERHWGTDTTGQILGPVLESAADLLVNGDLTKVKHCEAADCVLWFYDRTRSHRRRWCSMATCGTRNKVAAFRQRE